MNKSTELVQILLKFNAEIDVRDIEGRTALHQAVLSGKFEAVGILLKAGATVKVGAKLGEILLHFSEWKWIEAFVDCPSRCRTGKQYSADSFTYRGGIFKREDCASACGSWSSAAPANAGGKDAIA